MYFDFWRPEDSGFFADAWGRAYFIDIFLNGMLLFGQVVKLFWLNSVSDVTIPQIKIIRHAKSMKRS